MGSTEAILAQDKAKIAKLQITCIVCHNEKRSSTSWKASYGCRGQLYGINEMDSHEDPVFEKVKKSAVMQHWLMCGQCHGLGPNLEFENPVQCANLYGGCYLHAYIPAGGSQTCRGSTHMKPIDGLADHLMAPNWDDIPQTTELLQAAPSLDVQTLGYEWLEKAKTYVPKIIVEHEGRFDRRTPDSRRVTIPQSSGPGSDRKDTGQEGNRHPDATLSSSGNE